MTRISWNTGYGYNDPAEALEKFMRRSLEQRQPCASHHRERNACVNVLTGVLRPGDELYCRKPLRYRGSNRPAGRGQDPYDFGISYQQVELKPDGSIDLEVQCISSDEPWRFKGYRIRMEKTITIEEIEKWASYKEHQRIYSVL